MAIHIEHEMHENSLKAFTEEQKMFTERAWEIRQYALTHGNSVLTDRSIKEALGYSDMNDVRPRITEMIKGGWMDQIGEKVDEDTGKTVRIVKALVHRRSVTLPKERLTCCSITFKDANGKLWRRLCYTEDEAMLYAKINGFIPVRIIFLTESNFKEFARVVHPK